MDWIDTDRAAKLIERGMLSSGMMSHLLLQYAKEDRPGLEKLLSGLRPEQLASVLGFLDLYPHTELGWSVIPKDRARYLSADMDRKEAADIERILFQEDRPTVEYLRDRVHQMCLERCD